MVMVIFCPFGQEAMTVYFFDEKQRKTECRPQKRRHWAPFHMSAGKGGISMPEKESRMPVPTEKDLEVIRLMREQITAKSW